MPLDKSLSGTKILCVDDDLDCLDLLRSVLIQQGAQVTVSDTAERAIALLKEERFDVVISDISMPPGLDGYDLAHALRKLEDQDPDRRVTPTVAASGDALKPNSKRHFADFQVYMKKPIDRHRLVYIVERLAMSDGDSVRLGSLGSWVAEQATQAAVVATEVAATATAAAADATAAAVEATAAAVDSTSAAANAKISASKAEVAGSSPVQR